MSDTQSFRALYYPYSRCTNENTLKRAILLFDEVWFIDPTTWKMREGLLTDESGIPPSVIEDWKVLRDTYGILQERGLITIYDPARIIKENDQLLSSALKADLNDDDVWKLCTAPGTPDTWSILRKKVPPSAFEFLNSQGYPRVNYGTARARMIFHKELTHFSGLGPDSMIFESETKPFNPETLGRDWEEWFRYVFNDDRRAWHSDDLEFSCIFPFTHGSSLVLNQALLISDTWNLIPFTDSDLHHQLLDVKYRRVLNNLQIYKKTLMSGSRPFHPEKIRRIALTLFNTIIPEHALDRISISDAIKYRDSSKESFERLKVFLAELTSQVEYEIWDDKFEAEIQAIVHQKIVPEAQKAKNSALEIYEKMFGTLAKKAVAALTPTVGASVFAGLTFPAILLIGSASVLGSVLPDFIDAYLEERKLKRNSLSYLIKIQQR